MSSSVLQGSHQPFVGGIQTASAQLDTPAPALFANPGTDDFLSYAIAIMPTVEGANLNTSSVTGSTTCDLLVPVTYIDAGCMNSLPLLFPFEVQANSTEPVNQTVTYANYSQASMLDVSIGVASNNITAGETQTVSVTVSDQNSTEPVEGAVVLANVTDSYFEVLYEYSGTTDDVGQVSFPFIIPIEAFEDIYEVSVLASADGYDNATASTSFEVVTSSGDFYDNSTFDESTSDDYNYDDGSSSSSDNNNNDDFDSPTVKSVDPNDNQNDVSLNTEIKVTFDENMDQDTLDDGSLDIFNLDTGIDPGVNANPSSKSVTYTLDRQLEPGTRYEAQLDFNIQDDNGNYLDCSNSNDVDSSCTWQFDTTGTSGVPTVTASPKGGLYNSDQSVTLTSSESSTDIFFTTDGTNPTTSSSLYSGPIAISTDTTLKFFGEDASGNQGVIQTEIYIIDKTPPTVLSTIPDDGDTGVSVVDPITATFSEAVQASTVTNSTFTLQTDTADIEGSVSLSGNTATFDPTSNLDSSTNYTATITTGVKDLAGNPLASDNVWEFTTAPTALTAAKIKTTPEPLLTTANQSNATGPSNSENNVSDPVTVETETILPDSETLSKVRNETSEDRSISEQPKTETTVPDSESVSEAQNETSQDRSITGQPITKQTSDNSLDISESRKEQDREDRVLFDRYLRNGGNAEPDTNSKVDSREANNQPVAINDKAMTSVDVPVKLSILGNDKDADNDKLKIMGLSPPNRGTIVSNNDGTITYLPEKSWAGTEVFSYSISDGRGGIAAASVGVTVQPGRTENHIPRAQDDVVSTNENSPVKISLKAIDPDNDNLRFSIENEPSHGRIAEFSSSSGTLIYIPDENYDGNDNFKFKVNDGTANSENAEVTIRVKNVKDSSEERQQAQQEQSRPPADQQSTPDKSNGDTAAGKDSNEPPPSDGDNGQASTDDQPQKEEAPTPPKDENNGDTVKETEGSSEPSSSSSSEPEQT